MNGQNSTFKKAEYHFNFVRAIKRCKFEISKKKFGIVTSVHCIICYINLSAEKHNLSWLPTVCDILIKIKDENHLQYSIDRAEYNRLYLGQG